MVNEILEKAANIYKERQNIYGNTYKRTGKAAKEIFPNEIILKTEYDFSRFFILITIIGKIIRYSNNFSNGGHKDSLDDIITYTAMLQEIDNENQK